MSDLRDFGYSPARAAVWNQDRAHQIGYVGQIPPGALEAVPELAAEYHTTAFAEAVHDLQRILFTDPDEYDGKLGRGTWRATLARFAPVDHGANYIVYRGRRIALPEGRAYVTINFDQPGGQDLHPEADFQHGRAPGKPLRETVNHWFGGVFTPHAAFNYFCNAVFNDAGVIIEDPRNVSSHGCISLGRDGIVYVHQWIDCHHRTWHGGSMNPRSTGWDWLVDPRPKYLEKCRSLGWDVEIARDRRGEQFVTMDPRLARGGRQFLDDLHVALELGPVLIPLGANGLQTSGEPFDGVIDMDPDKSSTRYGTSRAICAGRAPANCFGHHHGSRNKSDIRPYMPAIFPEFYS